jgi:phosphatidylserine decarboxylase
VSVLPPRDWRLEKGAELGRFNMGSTVIVLFEPGRVKLAPHLRAGVRVKVAQSLGSVRGGDLP